MNNNEGFLNKQPFKQIFSELRKHRHMPPEMILAYARGVLSQARSAKAASHIEDCKECADVLALAREILKSEQEIDSKIPESKTTSKLGPKLRSKLQLVAFFNSKKDELVQQIAKLFVPRYSWNYIEGTIISRRDSQQLSWDKTDVDTHPFPVPAFLSTGLTEEKSFTEEQCSILIDKIADFVDLVGEELVEHCDGIKNLEFQLPFSVGGALVELNAVELDISVKSSIERVFSDNLLIFAVFYYKRRHRLVGGDLFSTKVREHIQFRGIRQVAFAAGTEEMVHMAGFEELHGIDLWLTKITDADLAHLNDPSRLRVLHLQHAEITDAGLAHLKNLRELRELWVDGLKITDAGLAHLKDLTRLRVLHLEHTETVTDAGLVHLKKLRRLRELWLDGSKITDADLGHLKKLRKLQELQLPHAKITGPGLAHLMKLRRLSSLSLDSSEITKIGLVYLRGMMELRHLCVRNMDFSFWSVMCLKGMPALQRLDLVGTRIADTVFTTLHQHLPGIIVKKISELRSGIRAHNGP